MGIRKKLLDFKHRLSDRHMYSIVLVVTAVIASAGIYQYKKAMDYRNFVENQYNKSFHELVGYVQNIEVTLAKSMLVNSPRQMVDLSSEIWRQSASAQADLGQLPLSQVQLDKTSKFLSQLGDYTYSLSRKSIDGQSVTDEDFSNLLQMHKYAQELSQSLANMESDVYSGRIKFGELKAQASKHMSQDTQNVAYTELTNIEKQFQDYPTLIYDGPFSEHVERMEPQLLKGGKEVSQDQAKDAAVKFLGPDKAQNIEFMGDNNGTIKAYTFAAKPAGTNNGNQDRRITLDVTKINGNILWMLDNRPVTKISLDMNQAKEKAKAFLDAKGIKNMKESYYLKTDGIAVINYAYVQDNIIMYPDLVKVRVALDDGEIIGFESNGYVMAHQEKRSLPSIKVTEAAARAKINSRLKVDSSRLAVIPLESKREVFCYEFKGSFDNKNFLVYVNVETGKEEKILMLMETPDGTLTM